MPPTAYGMVYLITDGEYHKIGRATDVNRRLNELQTASSRPLVLVCKLTTFCMQKLEQQLHQHYANKRIRGEWFILSQEEVQEIMLHPLSDKEDGSHSILHEALTNKVK